MAVPQTKKALATQMIVAVLNPRNAEVSRPRNAEEALPKKVPAQTKYGDPTPKMPVKAYMNKSAKPLKKAFARNPQKKALHQVTIAKSLPKN